MNPIPLDRLTISYARSGGPGGQNVNKVETKVEIRFVVRDADWIPDAARLRLLQDQRTRITSGGELVVTSSRHRTRSQNLDECVAKIEDMLRHASRRVIPRVATKPTRGSERRRLEDKKRSSARKRDRGFRGDE